MNESTNIEPEADSLDAVLRAAYSVLDEAKEPQAPPMLERFEILESLGSGGMGEVFSAKDRVLGRTVAIKTVRSERRLDEEARARLLREARILSQFQHPAICRLYDYLPRESADVLVLEYIEGTTLGDWVRAGQPRRELLRVLVDVASALEAAHRAGVVHRDLKPANIMVSRGGATKVLDFGIARHGVEPRGAGESGAGSAAQGGRGGETPPGATEPGRVVGTLQYMSPEQARGEEASAPSDMYSFGIIMQELLSGEPVRSRTTLNALRERGAVGDALKLPPRTEGSLRRLIVALRTDDLKSRPSAKDVREALEGLLRRPLRVALTLVGLGVVAAAILFAFVYVRDLGAERDRVLGRQRQAEGLISFLLDRVAPRILDVGPRELMDDVDTKALEYFQAVDIGEYTDSEWQERSKAVEGIAERVRESGDLEGAHRVHLAELRAIEERLRRDPKDPGWLFRRGQAEFYVGQALRDLGDLESCGQHWRNYLEVSEQLVELEPTNGVYGDEVAYARTNIGFLEVEGHRPGKALEHFRATADHWERRSASNPSGPEAVEWADALSFVGKARESQGEFAQAVEVYGRELVLRKRLFGRDPANRTMRHGLALAHMHHARAEARAGDLEGALGSLSDALGHLDGLLASDPEHTPWRRSLALCLMVKATLLDELGRFTDAKVVHGRGIDVLEALVALDPDNGDWRYLHEMARTAEFENRVSRGSTEGSSAGLERELVAWGETLEGRGPASIDRTLLDVRVLLMLGDLGEEDLWAKAHGILGTLSVPDEDRLLWRRVALLELRLLLRMGSMGEAEDLAKELMILGPMPPEIGREWAEFAPSRSFNAALGVEDQE